MNDISCNTKLEIAVEIIASKIAMLSLNGHTVDNVTMKKLIKEREEMYKGNKEVIEKILSEYGPEIKKKYELQ